MGAIAKRQRLQDIAGQAIRLLLGYRGDRGVLKQPLPRSPLADLFDHQVEILAAIRDKRRRILR